MKVMELIEKIATTGYTENELKQIMFAARLAYDIATHQKVAEMKSTLKAGDKVTLSGLRPKSINGLVGTVVEVNRTRVRVDMPTDFRAGRWSGVKGVSVPLSCVTKQ